MKPITSSRRGVAAVVAMLTLLAALLPATAGADHGGDASVQPSSVTVAGSLQSELGCPGDWQPECAATRLAFDAEDTVWQGTFAVPAGNWEYKAPLNDSWDENYGAGGVRDGANIALGLAAPTDVRFYYDHVTHWVTDSVTSQIATVAGSFQSELGCSGDWQPWCLRSWLQDADGDGIYSFTTAGIPPGDHEFKIALDEDWAISYPAANVAFSVTEEMESVTFTFDASTTEVGVTVDDGGVTFPDPPADADIAQPSLRTGLDDEVFYFVLPDRFHNGDPGNDCGDHPGACDLSGRLDHGWDPGHRGFYHGGDLAGLLDKIDYIEDLGVTAIWMAPVFKNRPVQGTGEFISAGYHGYWTTDYTQIDPHFGTNEELGALIDEAHLRGIKVFFDIITNHTADVIDYVEGVYSYVSKADEPFRDATGEPFDDVAFAGTDTFPALDPDVSFPYTPTFNSVADETVKVPAWLNDPTYYHNRGNSSFVDENSVYGDFFGLDDLFTAHPDVVDGMIDIFQFWTSEYDIDGFRIDTVKHVNIEFWQEWVPAILDHTSTTVGNDDFFMFGEVFDPNPAFLSIFPTQGQMQAVLDFGFQAAAQAFAADSAPTSDLADFFADDDWYIDTDSNAYSLPTFLGNHDMGRIGAFIVDANPGADDAEWFARDVLAHALMYAARGMPVIYSGDEQGFTGAGGDQLARQDLDPSLTEEYWDDDQIGSASTPQDDNFDQTHPIYEELGDLGQTFGAHEALRSGAQLPRFAQDSAGVIAFSRVLRDERVEYLVAANNSGAETTATFDTLTPGASFEGIYTTESGNLDPLSADGAGEVTVTLPPFALRIWRADRQIPASDSAPAITLGEVDRFDVDYNGHERHGLSLSATIDRDMYAEVSFAISVGGADWEIIGTDDHAPYGVHYETDAPGGTPVQVKAVVNDLNGNLASTVVEGTVPAGPDDGGGVGCDLGYAIIHYQRDDGAEDDWGLWLFGDIDDPVMDGRAWPDAVEWNGEDDYGPWRWVDLAPGATEVGFIVLEDGVGTKDGTEADRFFDPSVTPEIWLRQGDATTYTSAAAAQGYVTVHYQRPDGDYGDPTSDDFNDFWGLHLWGDALGDGVATDWPQPRKPDGIDDFGAYWDVPIDDAGADFNFIVHRGDVKDPGPDMSVVPADDFDDVWIQSGEEEIHRTAASATDTVVLHYQRPDGEYGDPSSPDFNDFWGVHTWQGAVSPTSWPDPVRASEIDRFGAVYAFDVVDDATDVAYIIHRGDLKDLPADQFLDTVQWGHEVWIRAGVEGYLLPTPACGGAGEGGSLTDDYAHWLTTDTIAWDVEPDADGTYALHAAPDGGLSLVEGGVIDGGASYPLEWVGDSLPADLAALWPHLADLDVLRVPDGVDVPEVLRGQIAVSAVIDGVRVDATGLQIPGVLDDLYATDAPLGVTFDGDAPTLHVWAPTAKSVSVRFYVDGDTDAESPDAVASMTRDDSTGIWSVTGDAGWNGWFYLFEVEVYVPSTGAVETNLVTDPYSFSLSTNSTKSQIVDLSAADLAPDGWAGLSTVGPSTFEEVNLYELHVRDFSISDETVPEELRGTYGAFTLDDSDGMRHLAALADAGMTHVHLLPTFDIATIEEDRSAQVEPEGDLDSFAPDSTEQQARVLAVADADGFNWGYDPFHYTTPEGSYAVDPMGSSRITEYRQMVAGLKGTGLGVVQDVVYNHTAQAGQGQKSVLDRIVPGYYHRLLEDGTIATSTCCQNTAPEHAMMGRLVVDSVVTWAREYKIDGFRFDLMGHHPRDNMLAVRAALDALTPATDGVDGSRIVLYGEGWNFGEVANDARFVQATQLNMAGTGIGTFNDRLRDGVRGGGPFDADPRIQGFGSGGYTDPNGAAINGSDADQLARLLLNMDQIRVGLAGNLADYTFVDRNGDLVTGADVDYNGSPTGYTADPQENVIYTAAHDNETLFDSNIFKLPVDTTMDTRVRMQALGIAPVIFGQGISFLHAGQELLRSKSLDRNSYNSGDHFNELDFSYASNNFGSGLPPAPDNADKWPIMQPLLADPALAADQTAIEASFARVRELLEVQQSSPLFALTTAEQVQQTVRFLNTGVDQLPGLIAMHLDDTVGLDLDPDRERLVVLFNARPDEVAFTVDDLAGVTGLRLHPVLANSEDDVVAAATVDQATATFTVPGRTVAVFEQLTPITVSLRVQRTTIVEGAGNIPVAILSADGFDAPADVDAASLRFGAGGTEAAPWDACVTGDVDGDGRADLRCTFRASQTGLVGGDTSATLTGTTRDGTPIVGHATLTVRSRGRPSSPPANGGGGGRGPR